MATERTLKIQWADQIEEQPIKWLWRPWLARGTIGLIDGYPGVGKSTMMFDLIARITTGRPFPLTCGREAEQALRPAGS
jgi:predicted ATP-dependent serine protease